MWHLTNTYQMNVIIFLAIDSKGERSTGTIERESITQDPYMTTVKTIS